MSVLQRFVVVVVLGASAGLVPAAASASPESRALVREGFTHLQAGRYAEAQATFASAQKADPGDPEAAFFLGAAQNRTGDHVGALRSLRRAQALNAAHPDLSFELGWALLRGAAYPLAIAELEQYDRAQPGRAHTSEFLARAYLGIAEYAKAEAKLNEALKRDPALRLWVLGTLAELEIARGNQAAARQHLDTLKREAKDAVQTGTLPEAARKPWFAEVGVAGGYNSNAMAFGDGVTLRREVPDTRSGFARTTLAAGYAWQLRPDHALAVGYNFSADVYDNVSGLDTLVHTGRVDWLHRITPDIGSAVRLFAESDEVGGRDFRTLWGIRLAGSWRFTKGMTAELAYTVVDQDFKTPTPLPRDRDANTHTLAPTLYFAVPWVPRLSGRVGSTHVWNLADGSDHDYRGDGMLLGLTYRLPWWRITLDGLYTRAFDRYAHLNSLAARTLVDGDVGYFQKRRDTRDLVGLEATAPVPLPVPVSYLKRLLAVARYDYTDVDSNVKVYNYHAHVWTFGFRARF